MSFKDKVNDTINDATKEYNIDHIADLIKQEQDQEYIDHGGPWGRPLFGNIDGNGNGDGHDDENQSSNTNNKAPATDTDTETEEERIAKLIENPVSAEDIDFVLETMYKEAQYDKISIQQLFYGMLSAFTKTGIPHNVNSKDAGSGKNYLLELVSKYFPDRYVEQLVGTSDKAFLHKRGIPVIKDKKTGKPMEVGPIIKKLEKEIEELGAKFDLAKEAKDTEQKKLLKSQIEDKYDELKTIEKSVQKLIKFENLIIIMPDTPTEGFWANIMSLMSQDTNKPQEYLYTDKAADNRHMEASGNIIEGMPVIFSAQTVDDSENKRFGEKNRRSILITPNTDDEKLSEAIRLIGMSGLCPEQYDDRVVSRDDQKLAKEIVEILVEKLIAHSKHIQPRQYGIETPFHFAISKSIPVSLGVWSMTVMKRIMLYLAIMTKANMDQRPRLLNTKTGAFYPLSFYEDLEQDLILMERGASNIRVYLAKAYNDAILPAYKDLGGAVKTRENWKGEPVEQEDHCGLTTQEIATELHKRLKIPLPSINETYYKYLKPLSNHGLMNYSRSILDKRENLWYPVDENTTAHCLFNDSTDLKLKIMDESKFPTINVLEQEYGSFIKQRQRGGVENKKNIFKLLDVDGEKITVDELLRKYYQHPETCFKHQNDVKGDSV